MRHLVSVYEAKTQLSSLLEKVASGDEVVITNRGNPVAELVPVKPASQVQIGLYQGVWPKWNPDDLDAQALESFREGY